MTSEEILLINNAGIAAAGGFLAKDKVESARTQLETNFFGPLRLSRESAPGQEWAVGGAGRLPFGPGRLSNGCRSASIRPPFEPILVSCKARDFADAIEAVALSQTLNRKFSTSPSLTMYSLPSARIFPASFAPCSPLKAMKSG